MNRSFDIFRMGANGIDPDRGTGRADQMRARTNHPADPPFDHGVHHHPEGEWGHHAQHLDRSADYGYGDRDREDRERARYHQGMYGMGDTRDLTGFPHSHYGNTASNEPYPPSRTNPDVWRGRNEDYDFWGRERHEGYHGAHPSLWQRVKGAFSGKGPKNYTRSDERIHEDVCEHLTHHPYVDASDIEVTVREGEVTLSGTVDARMAKRAAEEACDHVRGVNDVHNQLRVRPRQEAGTSAGTGPARP
jgi:hypothetical protein